MTNEQLVYYIKGVLDFNKTLSEEQVNQLKAELSKVSSPAPYTSKPNEIHQPITMPSPLTPGITYPWIPGATTIYDGVTAASIEALVGIQTKEKEGFYTPTNTKYNYILSENGPMPTDILRRG